MKYIVFRDPKSPGYLNGSMRKVGMVVGDMVRTWGGLTPRGPKWHWKAIPLARLDVHREATMREREFGAVVDG